MLVSSCRVAGIVLAALVAAPASLPAKEPADLHGPFLRQAVSGRTIVLSTPVGALPIRYAPNGTMSGKAGTVAQTFMGPKEDRGIWWVSGAQFCQRWKKWLDGRPHCYRLRRNGSVVHWKRDDGATGTARIN